MKNIWCDGVIVPLDKVFRSQINGCLLYCFIEFEAFITHKITRKHGAFLQVLMIHRLFTDESDNPIQLINILFYLSFFWIGCFYTLTSFLIYK